MKTKSIFILLAMTALSLTSCDKSEFLPEYMDSKEGDALTNPAATNNVSALQGTNTENSDTISSIHLSFVSEQLRVGNYTSAIVTATYPDGSTKNVTSESTLSTSSSFISISGPTITSIKKIGCTGAQPIIATYHGKTVEQNITVMSDYSSISISGSMSDIQGSRIGDYFNGDDQNINVEREGQYVNACLSGTIYSISGEQINIATSDFVKAYFDGNKMSVTSDIITGSSYARPYEKGVIRIEYLGVPVQSFDIIYGSK